VETELAPATTHRTPSAANARARPNPVGPASEADRDRAREIPDPPADEIVGGISLASSSPPVTPSLSAVF
jgi:hypothetical protein